MIQGSEIHGSEIQGSRDPGIQGSEIQGSDIQGSRDPGIQGSEIQGSREHPLVGIAHWRPRAPRRDMQRVEAGTAG